MINRTKIKDSIYDILDKDQKEIKSYIEGEAEKTEEQKTAEKEKRNKKSNIVDVNLAENLANQETNPFNQIVIHTEKDNLTHNYFHSFEMYWDAGDCLSSMILKLPKTDTGNTKYWITYTGEVAVYLGSDIERQQKQSTNSENQAVTNETYWSLQGMSPIFKGEIGRIKEYQEVLEIHVDSIGKRFKQKIPDDFRQAFINNQNVRDAFQAICEFLGVKYICPPPTAPEQDEETETDSAETDGTENDVTEKTQQEQQLASAASQAADQAKNNVDGSANTGETDQAENTEQQNALTDTAAEEGPQNGYGDISFDANGSIVHGSVVIETSPDMEDTLLALEEHPLDKYLEDTTYVSVDVKKFLDGEMFDTIHGNYLDYNAVTIEPKSSNSSEMSTVGTSMDANGDGTVTEEEAAAFSQNLLNSGQTNIGLKGIAFVNNNGGGGGGDGGKIALSYDQVNSMDFYSARIAAERTDKYYWTTILRLRARGAFHTVGPNTPYYQFNY